MSERANLQAEAKKRNLTATGTNEVLRQRIADDKASKRKTPAKKKQMNPKLAKNRELLEEWLKDRFNPKDLTPTQVKLLSTEGYVKAYELTKKGLDLLNVEEEELDGELLKFYEDGEVGEHKMLVLEAYGYLKSDGEGEYDLTTTGNARLGQLGVLDTEVDSTDVLDKLVVGWVLIELDDLSDEWGGRHYRSLKAALEEGLKHQDLEEGEKYELIVRINQDIEARKMEYLVEGENEDVVGFKVEAINFVD